MPFGGAGLWVNFAGMVAERRGNFIGADGLDDSDGEAMVLRISGELES